MRPVNSRSIDRRGNSISGYDIDHTYPLYDAVPLSVLHILSVLSLLMLSPQVHVNGDFLY